MIKILYLENEEDASKRLSERLGKIYRPFLILQLIAHYLFFNIAIAWYLSNQLRIGDINIMALLKLCKDAIKGLIKWLHSLQ